MLRPVGRPSQFADCFSDRARMLQTGGERQVGKKPTEEREGKVGKGCGPRCVRVHRSYTTVTGGGNPPAPALHPET